MIMCDLNPKVIVPFRSKLIHLKTLVLTLIVSLSSLISDHAWRALHISSALAYEFVGSTWSLSSGGSVPYQVNFTLSADIADGPCLAAVQAGFQRWTEVSCSYMTWRDEGRTNNTGWGVDDQENVVSWRESSWDDSSAALAITSNIFDFRGFIDTDIKFNGLHHNWAIIGSGNARGVDVESVTAHEVGHAVGLDHSSVSGATMWPSTGPNDASARTLAQDDINGLCALYPSGGEVPTPPDDPPPTMGGTASFGEPCTEEACEPPLFCVSDGVDQFCTQSCNPNAPCPSGYYCAQLSSGSGACAPGEPPMADRAGFNERCGEQVACEAGLLCISDGEESYCSTPCDQGQCPEGFDCAGLQGGGDICARESNRPAPNFGEPCEEQSGRCAEELFCLSDPLYVSSATGDPIPYCSRSCGDGCPQGYRCAELMGSGDACQREPSAGARAIGDECWVNPEMPFEDPTCGDGLRCVGSRRDPTTQELTDLGRCTISCTADTCCPQGWGCASVTPFLALCAEGVVDDEGFECMGARPEIERPSTEGAGSDEDSGGMTQDTLSEMGSAQPDTGCVAERTSLSSRNHPPLICVLVALMLFFRAKVTHDNHTNDDEIQSEDS